MRFSVRQPPIPPAREVAAYSAEERSRVQQQFAPIAAKSRWYGRIAVREIYILIGCIVFATFGFLGTSALSGRTASWLFPWILIPAGTGMAALLVTVMLMPRPDCPGCSEPDRPELRSVLPGVRQPRAAARRLLANIDGRQMRRLPQDFQHRPWGTGLHAALVLALRPEAGRRGILMNQPVTVRSVVAMLALVLGVGYIGYHVYRAATDPMRAEKPRLRPESSAALAKLTSARVVMFGTSRCPYCAQARELFDRHDVSYVEFDLDHDREAVRFAKDHLKLRMTPYIVIGNRVLIGYGEDQVLAALKEP